MNENPHGNANGQNQTTSIDATMTDFKIGENDCPCFEGMFEFS
jgi:hypothetical protein